MPLTMVAPPNRTRTSIGQVRIELTETPNPGGGFSRSAIVVCDVLDQNGAIMHTYTEKVPPSAIPSEQQQQGLGILAWLRSEAVSRLLP